jgi:hypothetical protein
VRQVLRAEPDAWQGVFLRAYGNPELMRLALKACKGPGKSTVLAWIGWHFLTCYLHPDREALLRCSRCERPICSDDMIEAPVGYQCPKCAEGGSPVRRLVDLQAAPLTRSLVYVIAGLFILTRAVPGLVQDLGERPKLVGPGGPVRFSDWLDRKRPAFGGYAARRPLS